MKTLCVFLLLATAIGCSKSSSPTAPSTFTDTTTTPPLVETPFAFHKPSLGATFSMEAISHSGGKLMQDTTFVLRVADTAATQDGKSGVLRFDGYYSNPFYISYRSTGDIDVWGFSDYLFGRNEWTGYPLALPQSRKAEIHFSDSLISNPNPKDTRQVVRDSVQVMGTETLTIKGQPVQCIKAVLSETYTLTNLQFGFTTSNLFVFEYWYAPSLGYWAKEHNTTVGTDITFQLVDYTP